MRKLFLATFLLMTWYLCSSCVLSTTTATGRDTDTYTAQLAVEPCQTQQACTIQWCILTLNDRNDGIVCPIIHESSFGADEEVAKTINSTMQRVLLDYMELFVEGTIFSLKGQVMRFDGDLLSILYDGEAWTPAQGIRQTFALNFKLVRGELLALDYFIEESDIVLALKDGLLKDQESEEVFESFIMIPPYVAYQSSCLVTDDLNHTFDFFFDHERFFVIVENYSVGGYSIYGMELG